MGWSFMSAFSPVFLTLEPLEAHWLTVPGDQGSNTGGGVKFVLFHF